MAVRWKQAIVVGASSGVGEAVAKLLAAQGCRVALVARRAEELQRIADEMARHGDPSPLTYAHDVTAYEEVPELFQRICRELGGLDLIVYSAGVMPKVDPDEYCFDKDRAIFEVNVLGAMAWLNEAAVRFAAARSGTLVGISSVAGDRGRRGQPAYGASKAALNTYLEALHNRVARFGVDVVTIKPGPIDTPMTRGIAGLPMMISADEAARGIVAAASSGANTAYVPGKWRFVMAVIRAIPSFIFRRMNL